MTLWEHGRRSAVALAASIALAASAAQAHEAVSINAAGTAVANDEPAQAVFSPDGRLAVFVSFASDLGHTDTNNRLDLYMRDLQTGVITLISSNAAGTDGGNSHSYLPVFSPNGRLLAFTSEADNLGPADHNGLTDVYVRDLLTGVTTLVSVNGAGTDSSDGFSTGAKFNGDSHRVFFVSDAGDLGPTDTNADMDVYQRDLQTGTTTLISTNAAGTDSGNAGLFSYAYLLSGGGRYLAFETPSNNLGPSDNNGKSDCYLRDLQTGTMQLVSVNAAGTDSGNEGSSCEYVSRDGRLVFFGSDASDLGPLDTYGENQVFVRDMQTGITTLVSTNAAEDAAANRGATLSGVSPDERYVVLVTRSDDLGPTDSNSETDLYLRDLQTGTVSLLTVNGAGTDSGQVDTQSSVTFGSFSPDGRFATFSTSSGELGSLDTNGASDVYVRDLQTHITKLVSVNATGTDSANAVSTVSAHLSFGTTRTPNFSPDGLRLVFVSRATDLGVPDSSTSFDAFLSPVGFVSHDWDGDGTGNGQDSCPADAGDDADGDGLCDNEVLYLSATSGVTLGGVAVADEDIVRFDERTGSYSIHFDGSDVGLSNQDIDAFSIRLDGSILMSFGTDFTLGSLGTVRKQDVVRFVPTSTGLTTAGTFQAFFVGLDHGLTTSTANVTGVYEATDGRLFLNFGDAITVAGLAISTEDIVQFNPSTNAYEMVFDGSDMGLGPYTLGAFNFQRDGSLLLSLTQYPTATGLPPDLPAGTKHNAFQFVPDSFPDSYGPNTAGTFHPFYVGAQNQAPSTLQLDGLFRERTPEAPVVYQAEWAVRGGNSLLESTNAGFVGSAYINSATTGGSIEFTDVHGGWGGAKVLRFRNALGASNSRTGRLVVNGVAQNVTFAPTGSWTTWTQRDVAVTLTAGANNTIRLETNGQDLANIDQFEVITLYQAESASIGGGSLVETTNAGFTGSAYINSASNGGSIEFQAVDGGNGGAKMLRVRNALGVSGSRTGQLIVNGVAQTVTFPSTGSWTTWTDRDIPVTLASGPVNTIRFETNGDDLANIDQLEIH